MRRPAAVAAVLASAAGGLGAGLAVNSGGVTRSALPAAQAKGTQAIPGLSSTGTLPRLRSPVRAAPHSATPSATPPAAPAPRPSAPTPRPGPSPPPPVVEF